MTTHTKEARAAYMRGWYRRNREKVRACVGRYAEAHPEERRAYQAEYRANPINKAKARALSAERAAKRRPEEMLRSARKRAHEMGVEFSITLADIVIPERCPLLGVSIHLGVGRSPYSPSLDRIVPELGYVPGNVWVISHRANTIKSDATADEIATVASNLRARLAIPRNF